MSHLGFGRSAMAKNIINHVDNQATASRLTERRCDYHEAAFSNIVAPLAHCPSTSYVKIGLTALDIPNSELT